MSDRAYNGKTRSVKAVGVKSVLSAGDTVYMTAFGNGNEAVLEKKIENGKVENFPEEKKKSVFEADLSTPNSKNVTVTGRKNHLRAEAAMPSVNQQNDMLRLKEKWEQKFFGRAFDDNVHIQIVYNILDIPKILTTHTTNIVYTLSNLLRLEGSEREELSKISVKYTYGDYNSKDFLEKFCKREELIYFGDLFYMEVKDNKGGKKFDHRKPEDIYLILALLISTRHMCVHGYVNGCDDSDTWLYNLDKIDSNRRNDKNSKGFLDKLGELFSKAINEVNNNYVKNNKVNLDLLKKMYPEEPELVRDFYRHTVLKSYKNSGFSVKKLREAILEISEAAHLKDEQFDTVRPKLNTLLDFAIVRYYDGHPSNQTELIRKLRSHAGNEKEKAAVYREKAGEVWRNIPDSAKKILQELNGDRLAAIKKTAEELPSEWEGKLTAGDVTPFSKMMFLLTKFIDGKEINILLTTLISKFDNITSLMNVAKDLKLEGEFLPQYGMFNKSRQITEELKMINAFSRMEKIKPNARRLMYKEALKLFDVKCSSEEEEKQLLDRILCLNEKEVTLPAGLSEDEELEEAMGQLNLPNYNLKELKKALRNAKSIPSADGIHITKRFTVKVSNSTGIRNFLASNVIDSSRFQYLVRYCNPVKAHKLSKNRKLVLFQLNRTAKDNPEQIERYYKACSGTPCDSIEKKTSFLAALICNMNLDDLSREDVWADNGKAFREEKKAIIGLYLTVLYQIVKNMVYVNARYVMAFAAVERDAALRDIQINDKKCKYWKRLTEYYTDATHFEDVPSGCPIKKKERDYLRKDMSMVSDEVIREFRNVTAHLAIVQAMDEYIPDMKEIDSYFGIYHYVAQRLILDNLRNTPLNPQEQKWKTAVEEYHGYCKDFTKALCTPFGYNVARFKNLSIKDLFDMNELKPTKEDGEIAE